MNRYLTQLCFLFLFVFLLVSCEKEIIQTHAVNSEGRCYVRNGIAINNMLIDHIQNEFEGDKMVIKDYGRDDVGRLHYDSIFYSGDLIDKVFHFTREIDFTIGGSVDTTLVNDKIHTYNYQDDVLISIDRVIPGVTNVRVDSFFYDEGEIVQIKRYFNSLDSQGVPMNEIRFAGDRIIKRYEDSVAIVRREYDTMYVPEGDTITHCTLYYNKTLARNPQFDICIPDLFPSFLLEHNYGRLKTEGANGFSFQDQGLYQGPVNDEGYFERDNIEYICF